MPHRKMSIKEWSKYVYALKDYVLTDLLHKIECPVLALVGDGEGPELMRQAKEFVNRVSSEKKELYVFCWLFTRLHAPCTGLIQ